MLIVFICHCDGVSAGETVVHIRSRQSAEDISHSYYIRLLEIALEKTEKKYGKAVVEIVNMNASQGRLLASLRLGEYIDVAWAGTDKKREKVNRLRRSGV